MAPRTRAARPLLRTILPIVPALLLIGAVVLVWWRIGHRPPTPEPDPPEQGKPLPFPAMASVLDVRCSPVAGKVYLNGTDQGKTPLRLEWRVTTNTTSTLQLEVRAQGYQPYREQIELHPGEWRTVSAKLGSGGGAGRVVCIDPGHPSETSAGASAPDGTTENHVNWVIAQKLKASLEASGFRIVMTKQSEGEFVTNKHRAEIANEAGAAMMVRLHCDSGGSSERGFAVYYPARPGHKGDVSGPSQDICEASKRAAQALHEGLAKALQGSLHDDGVKTDVETAVGGAQGALTGSIFAQVPVVTVEMMFLSNRDDTAFIKSDAGQQQMTQGLADGVALFVR